MKNPALFNIDYSLPPDGDKIRYTANCRTAVFAMTAARAIQVLQERHPTAEVHAVHRASRGTVIYDPELLPDRHENPSSHE